MRLERHVVLGRNLMIKKLNSEKMLQHDVVKLDDSITSNFSGFEELKKKEDCKQFGFDLIEKVVDEENRKNDEEIEKRVNDCLSNQTKIENIVVTEENLDEESEILIPLSNEALQVIQKRSNSNNTTPIRLLNSIICNGVWELKRLDDASLIVYDGGKARTDCLKKIELILNELPNSYQNPFADVKKAIHSVIGQKDPRTFKKYRDVFLHYHKKKTGFSSNGVVTVESMKSVVKSMLASR